MITFKNYITEARSRGEAMEEVIIAAVNKEKVTGDTFGIDPAAGEKVAKFLARKGVKGKGKVLGADQIDVSSEWSRFWDGKVPASTKTPKTDFMIGRTKISLKTGAAAQLMSGGKNESVATFYAAMNKTKNEMDNSVADKLTTMFEDLAPSSVAATDLRTAIKNQKDEVVSKANSAHKALMSELAGIFNSNQSFRDAFAYEAMSGEVKFGGNEGTCSHFLVTDFDGKKSSLHSVDDSAYVSKIAKQMKVSVRFKTTSVKKGKTKTGQYRYWSVIGLILDKMQEDIEYMNMETLTEGAITDFFKKVWERIKAAFKKAASFARQGVDKMIEFMEVEPVVSYNNTVRF